MDVFVLTAGVAAGAIMAQLFMLSVRAAYGKEDRDVPGLALMGMILILAFIAANFYLAL